MKMKISPKATLKAKVTRADGSVEYVDATNVTVEEIPTDTPQKPDDPKAIKE